MFPTDFSPSYKQKERERRWGRKREREGGKGCISGQCLLIAARHTSPQLSQIAIEKWPVMQLLANPGPWLPSIIKSCLSRGPLSGLSWCVVSLSHLPATSSPAATAGSGTRFPSATTHSVAHTRWYGQTKKLKLLYYIFQRLQWRWGGEGHNKMGLGFSWHINIEHENGIYRRVKFLCENCQVSFCFIGTFVSRKTTLILQRDSPLGPSFKDVQYCSQCQEQINGCCF